MDYFEDEDNYDNYDEDYEKEDIIQEEVNAFERVGGRNNFDLLDTENIDKKNKLKKTPLERFYETVNGVSQKLLEENKLSEGDIKIILQTIGLLDKPEYKNATGYILGYIVSGGGLSNINKTKLFGAIELVENVLEDKSVQPPDIIRYARLWMNLNKI